MRLLGPVIVASVQCPSELPRKHAAKPLDEEQGGIGLCRPWDRNQIYVASFASVNCEGIPAPASGQLKVRQQLGKETVHEGARGSLERRALLPGVEEFAHWIAPAVMKPCQSPPADPSREGVTVSVSKLAFSMPPATVH